MKKSRQPAPRAEVEQPVEEVPPDDDVVSEEPVVEKSPHYEIVEGDDDEGEGDTKPAPPEVYTQRSSGSEFFSEEDPVWIDLDSLDVDESAEIEELSGLALETILVAGTCSRRQLQALIYVCARRKHPDITFEDAGKAKPFEFEWVYDETEQGATTPGTVFFKGSPGAVALINLARERERQQAAEDEAAR